MVCPSDLAFGDAEPCGNASGRALILMLAFLHFRSTVGYAGVALLVGAESAGVPVPGETSLIAAAVLASQGHLSLPLVIALAAGSATVGDNVGYVIGRKGGHWLLTRPGR